jgi:hypothetical protein
MSTRLLIAVIAFCVALSGTIVGNLCLVAMIGEINRKRSGSDLVSYFGFALPKIVAIHREYRMLYPKGRLHFWTMSAAAAVLIGALTCAAWLLTA